MQMDSMDKVTDITVVQEFCQLHWMLQRVNPGTCITMLRHSCTVLVNASVKCLPDNTYLFSTDPC